MKLIQDTTGCVEPMDLNQEIIGAGIQFTLFCTNLSKFSEQLASLIMCFLSGITKGDNRLIARASFVGRQEPVAGGLVCHASTALGMSPQYQKNGMARKIWNSFYYN
jgi:hypothetical protein